MQQHQGKPLTKLFADITLQERLEARTDKSGDCWLWTGVKDRGGYGNLKIKGRSRTVHRLAYELAHGPIHDGLQVDHVCHVRACLNPGHLRLVTPGQNSQNHSGPRRDNKSGVRGVYWNPRRLRWVAVVKGQLVGRFRTLEEADAAVTARRIEVFTHNDLDRDRVALVAYVKRYGKDLGVPGE
jgi:hypothetical protein